VLKLTPFAVDTVGICALEKELLSGVFVEMFCLFVDTLPLSKLDVVARCSTMVDKGVLAVDKPFAIVDADAFPLLFVTNESELPVVDAKLAFTLVVELALLTDVVEVVSNSVADGF
jgi:hypothetical protein